MTIAPHDPLLTRLADIYDRRLSLSRDRREAVLALLAAYHAEQKARAEIDVVTLGKVCSYVSSMTGVPSALIGIQRRKRQRHSNEAGRARFVAMFAMREILEGELSGTARLFGVHHTTVLHGCRKVMESLELVAMARSAIQVAKGSTNV